MKQLDNKSLIRWFKHASFFTIFLVPAVAQKNTATCKISARVQCVIYVN